MHSLTIAALFAGTAFALPAADSSLTSCLTNHASQSPCADASILTHCLSNLETPAQEYITSCHIEAGCSSPSAELAARTLLSSCGDMLKSGADLRKRDPIAQPAPQPTTPPQLHDRYGMIPNLDRRATDTDSGAQTGDNCMTTKSVETEVCSTFTSNGVLSSNSCKSTTIGTASCKAGKTCSFDSQGTRICMDLENDLDTAGIVIAIVFAVIITTGIGALTYLCCKDKKDQKRLVAKAEATALARAATKKKRAAERAPLMSQAPAQEPDTSALGGGASGSHDPFQDSTRS